MTSVSASKKNLTPFVLLAAFMACAALPTPAHAACWKSFGAQSMFGTLEQGNALKALARENPKCSIIGISWSIDFTARGGKGIRYNALIWDEKAGTLVKFDTHKELGDRGTRWQQWQPVTRAAVLKEDYSDSIDFPGYRDGYGKAPLSRAAIDLVRKNHSGGALNASL
jgi:hypothetical protein